MNDLVSVAHFQLLFGYFTIPVIDQIIMVVVLHYHYAELALYYLVLQITFAYKISLISVHENQL